MTQHHPRPARRPVRLKAILDLLKARDEIAVSTISARFGVSESTIRRDLQLLADQDLVTRRYGHALAMRLGDELPVKYRWSQHREEKSRIAQAAVRLIPRGSRTIGFTGGTTTTAVAALLAGRQQCTIITNAVNIAMQLANHPRTTVMLCGGLARPQSLELVGPFAEQSLKGLVIDVLFIGVDGISLEGGLTTHDPLEAKTNSVMIRQSAHVIVTADGSKVGKTLPASIASVSNITHLVTDDSADPVALDALRQSGVVVVVAAAGTERHPTSSPISDDTR